MCLNRGYSEKDIEQPFACSRSRRAEQFYRSSRETRTEEEFGFEIYGTLSPPGFYHRLFHGLL
jgi:hypothetical protein